MRKCILLNLKVCRSLIFLFFIKELVATVTAVKLNKWVQNKINKQICKDIAHVFKEYIISEDYTVLQLFKLLML